MSERPAPTPEAALPDVQRPDGEPKAAVPQGEPPVCKVKNDFGASIELHLDWDGDAAKGMLRTVAASGLVRVQPVRAERYEQMIVADDPGATDLVVHAATVRERDGKRYIRLGDSNEPWSACE